MAGRAALPTGLSLLRLLGAPLLLLAAALGRARAFWAVLGVMLVSDVLDGSLSETLPGLPRGAPRAGDRFPWLSLKLSPGGPAEDLYGKLDDTRFALLLIGQPTPPDRPPGLGDLLGTQVVPADPGNGEELARVGIPRQAFYLLRPDGHVGLCGTRLEAGALTRYVSERLHIV